MAFSYVVYTADGLTTDFNIPFQYQTDDSVKVTVNDVDVAYSISSTDPSVVVLASAPVAGDKVKVFRETDLSSRAVDFEPGRILKADDLDAATLQVFYTAQEVADAADDFIGKTSQNTFDAQNLRVANVADPVNAQDAATKNYLETQWLSLADKAQLNALNIPNLNRVYTSINNIDRLHTSITELDRLHQSISNLDRVHTSIGNVDRVASSADNLDRVHTSVTELDRVAASADNLDRVHTSIANVDRVDQSITNVDRVATSANNLDRVATSANNLDRVHTSIANIDDVAADLNDVAGSSIDTVAASITNVNNVGSNIQNVIDVNANESNINAAVANQSNINASVANATNITKVANNEANINAVSANETNINQVSTDTVAVNNVSTNIGAVTNVSTNMTAVQNLDTNMAAIQNASTNIADVQTVSQEVQKVIDVANDLNEATSEIDTVAQSIANVDLVGQDIANVNIVATNLTDINAFADTYQISATAPTGVSEGSLWYDTTSDILKVYNGGSWQNAGSSVNGTSVRQDFVAAANDTTVTVTGGYDSGYVDVYLNGVKQIDGTDFTANNGADIVFTNVLAAGDEVSVVGYGTFALADHYNKTASDARYMPIDAVTLPDQTGHAGQFLTTDGTDADWATVDLTPYATTTYVDTEISNIDLSTRVATSGDTMTGALNFGDGVKAQFGAGNDLQISHNGSHSIIQDVGTGNLYVSGTELALVNGDFSQTYALFNSGGGSSLYHNNASKLATTSTGVSVTGTVVATSFTGDGSNLTGLPGGGGAFYRMTEGSFSSQGGSYVTLSFTNADTSKPIWVDVNMPNNVYLVLTANNASNGSFASNVGFGSNVTDTSPGNASFNFGSNPPTTSSIGGVTSGQRVGFWPTSSTCSFRFTRSAGDNGATAYFSVHH